MTAKLWNADGSPVGKLAPCKCCGAAKMGSYQSAAWCLACGHLCELSEDMLEHAQDGTAPVTLRLPQQMVELVASRSLHVGFHAVSKPAVRTPEIRAEPKAVVASAVLSALVALIDIVDRTGGYMTPKDQESLRNARSVAGLK